jgi:LytS/YehU family sensor histidine kinase
LAAGGASLLAVLFASQLYVWVNWWPVSIGWGTAFVWSIPQLLVWGLLTPLVLVASRRFPVERAAGGRRVLLHVAFSAALGFAGLALLDLSDRVVHWSQSMGAPSQLISAIKYTIIHLHMGIAVYWVILAADHAFRYHARSRESELRASRLETRLAQARLLALRDQLHPHFLFNTLNSIAVLMRRDVPAAERMLTNLSDLLRATLERAEHQLVTLKEELAYVQSYVNIESERFRDRLTVRFDVEDEALDARVPTLLLQPLVENAIRHGVAPRAAPGRVEIAAHCRNGVLEMSIRDDGPGLHVSSAEALSLGVGLTNTQRRLQTLYGDDHRFAIANAPHGGVEVMVAIPFDAGGDA